MGIKEHRLPHCIKMKFFLAFVGLFPLVDAFASQCSVLKSGRVFDEERTVKVSLPLRIGDLVTFQATPGPNTRNAVLYFAKGSANETDRRFVIPLYIRFNFVKGTVSFNSLMENGWNKDWKEQTSIKRGSDVKVEIRVLHRAYRIKIGRRSYEYTDRSEDDQNVQTIGFQGFYFKNKIACPPETGKPSKAGARRILISEGVVRVLPRKAPPKDSPGGAPPKKPHSPYGEYVHPIYIAPRNILLIFLLSTLMPLVLGDYIPLCSWERRTNCRRIYEFDFSI
ncbi:unnamed protein product [Caenorhabditis auriculariae]|uniref:Galectin n=1 Tax=Caenorhabditis auriculariae TaxID=2777116 RepID=A0A8S1H8P0_9PELO|nr:unnamed protein product [Caenorhabditis auriculariae]